MTVRHVQARRASGSKVRMAISANAARNAASCHAAKPHHLMAAPPVENRTAAATTLDLGVMGARNILPLRWRFRCLASEERGHARRVAVLRGTAHHGALCRPE